jgi:PAS domain S-box-containing protein
VSDVTDLRQSKSSSERAEVAPRENDERLRAEITARKRVEEELREAHHRLSLAQRAGQAGLWDWRMEQAAPFISAEFRELYGLTADEDLTYDQWLDRIYPEDRARVEAYGREVLDHGTEYVIEFRIMHPTRGLRWLGSSGLVYRDAKGRPERFSGINVDITTLKGAQLALRATEERFRKVFENAPTGISITDTQGHMLECNAALRALVGYSEDELRGLDFASLVHPDDRAANLAAIPGLLAGEVPSFEIENRYIRKGGDVIWVRKFVSVLSNESGVPVRLLALVTDTTSRHRAERELRASEARLRGVIDSMFALVWVLAPDGTLAEANRAPVEALGMTRAALIGKSFWDCPWWSHDEAVRADLQAAFARAVRGEVVRYDVAIQVAGGDRMAIDFMLQPVVEGERLRFVIASAVDITDRKRAEEAVREADRRKAEFLATLAHELRNPLAPLRTGFELLKRSADRATRERARAMMERQLGHMVRLIDDLLDVSRISRGKIELRREDTSLAVAIAHAVETSRPLIDAHRQVLTLDLPARPVWVHGDLTRLAQVVGNLLTNSAKYTPDGGRIGVSLFVDHGEAVIRVADSGVGIAPETLPGVFEVFAQAARDRDRSRGGLGIGLFLVRWLVEMHGGTVSAESPGVGQGSTFTVRLPLAPVAPREIEPAPAEVSLPAPVARRVLVVDDNEDAADSLATVLDLHGHETRTAYDGPSALAAAHAFAPEVVFLDIGMPGMSGHEVARRLRDDPALAGAFLVAPTGWGGQDDKRRTREAGFNFHLTKPVDVAAVEDVLAQCH